MGTASDVLRLAAADLGYDPKADPEMGSKFGRWYAAMTGVPGYGANGVAYCAMAASYWLANAGVQAAGMPGAYCPWILDAGFKSGEGVDWMGGQLQPGDMVLFSWRQDGVANHIGLVEYNRGAYRDASGSYGHIQTIEGNTSDDRGRSGVVARKTRSLATVCGAIRPRYAAATMPSAGLLEVDGWIGRKSVWAWGEQLGCDHSDVIRDQTARNVAFMPHVVAVTWGSGDGDWLVHAVQRKVGVRQDGHLGPVTIKAMQAFLGVGQDGVIGPTTASALQRSINEGRWK